MAKFSPSDIDQAWKKWNECLEEKDRNSIVNQIINLVWDGGIYRLIQECRRSSIKLDESNLKINNSLHSFIDRNFFEKQASSIRRLTESKKSKYSLYGPDSVYSLSALINDIKKHRDDLNREKYFELREITYDIDFLRKKQTDFLMRNFSQGEKGIQFPDEICLERSTAAHSIFDKLSQVNPNNRKPNDLVSFSVWQRLEEKVDICKELNDYVNKYIAHASSIESRISNNYEIPKIDINKLWDIHKNLCEVVSFLSLFISGSLHMFLPIESANFFENWDLPLIETKNTDILRTSFDKYRKETEMWGNPNYEIFE